MPLSSTSQTNSGYGGGENTFKACRPEPSGRERGGIYAQETKFLPIGRVLEAIESDDGRVRKAQVKVVTGGTKKTFMRPIKELVLLVPAPAEKHK